MKGSDDRVTEQQRCEEEVVGYTSDAPSPRQAGPGHRRYVSLQLVFAVWSDFFACSVEEAVGGGPEREQDYF